MRYTNSSYVNGHERFVSYENNISYIKWNRIIFNILVDVICYS